jgi:dienelactone hydrolase
MSTAARRRAGARLLTAVTLILALGAALPARAQETVHFPSADADLTAGGATILSGLLFRPPGEGPFAAVVLLHGCGGLRDGSGRVTERHDDWARRLLDRGWVVLLVDSFAPRGIREICSSAARPIEPGRERARDAYGALAYLQRQRFVRGDRVALLGWSNGGGTVLRTIAAASPARPADLAHDFRGGGGVLPRMPRRPDGARLVHRDPSADARRRAGRLDARPLLRRPRRPGPARGRARRDRHVPGRVPLLRRARHAPARARERRVHAQRHRHDRD